MILLASFSLGRVFGIPIRIHWSAFVGLSLLVASFCSWQGGRILRPPVARLIAEFILVAAIPITVLMHELAHALTAKRWGVGTRAIYLHVFGGLALVTDPAAMSVTPRQKMAIFAAGPASNLIACCSALLLAHFVDSLIVSRLIEAIAAINLGMGFFNLLPIWPLDGGQLFHAFLSSIRLRPRWADGITLFLSLLLGVPMTYGAWESGAYFSLSILLILLAAAVALLAIYRLEPETFSSDFPDGTEPAIAEHSGAREFEPCQ
jgi:Zn-dependent protease